MAVAPSPVLAGEPQAPRVLSIRFAANQATLPVTFGGRMTLPFLVDSGALHIGMSAPELSALGLKPAGTGQVSGAAGDITSTVYEVPIARVGDGLVLRDLLVRSLDLGPLADMDRPVGLLPLSALGVSLLNLVDRKLTVYGAKTAPPAGFFMLPPNDPVKPPRRRSKRGSPPDARPYGTVNLLDKTLKVMLDTGYTGALILTSKYVRDSGLGSAFGQGASRSLAGATGSVVASMMPVDTLGFAGQVFRNQWIELNDPAANIPGDVDYQGVVGMEILRRFDLWTAGETGAVGLRPNAWIDDVERYDRSGLDLALPASGGPGVTVVSVARTSPADQAGLKAGDIIDGYNGPYGLDDLRWTLSGPPGSRVTLQLVSGDGMQSRALTLAEPP